MTGNRLGVGVEDWARLEIERLETSQFKETIKR